MSAFEAPAGRPPLVRPGETMATVTAQISGIALRSRIERGWWLGFGFSALLVLLFLASILVLLLEGVGIWGIDIPVAWGFAIVNYVWWIAIASGGTLITAIFYLTGSEWRTSITRIAESMMVCAAACAGFFPILHLGRPWFFYWLVPYPATMGVWPQFRSPLLWDFFAVIVYIIASVLFWYVGLVPDLATLRDRARTPGRRLLYGIAALGWRGQSAHWRHYQAVYLVMAGMLTPLVVSIHSVVGLDFAGGLTPGWHSTLFPPFFVFGAMLSGFAMVLALVIPVRHAYGLQNLITPRHIDVLAKLLVASSIAIGYAYFMEAFSALYGDDQFERADMMERLVGAWAPFFWGTVLANVTIPQILWSPTLRARPAVIMAVSLVVIVGMWLERYLVVITSLARDFMPSIWHRFMPTLWDWGTFAGSIGLFLFGVFLFLRYLPIISMSEMRRLVPPEPREGEMGP